MSVEQLQQLLEKLLIDKQVDKKTEIVFRHSIHDYSSNYSSLDYVLTKQVDEKLVLCYDDGMM